MKKFLKANGYYLVLIACVVAVCIGGIVMLEKRAANEKSPTLLNNNGDINAGAKPTLYPTATIKPSSSDPDKNDDKTVSSDYQDIEKNTKAPSITEKAGTQTAPSNSTPAGSTDTSIDVNKPVSPDGTAKPTGDNSTQNTNKIKFVAPVEKLTVLTVFENNKLIYNKTMKEWKIHSAIDLAAESGSNVLCVLDGKVSDIRNDPLYGTTIIITHEGDLQTVYCGIGVINGLTVGKEVKQGAVLGTVAENGVFCEKDLGSHIHFEVIQAGKKVNPVMFFDAQADSQNNGGNSSTVQVNTGTDTDSSDNKKPVG